MMEAVAGFCCDGAGWGGRATLSMETLEAPSSLTGKGALAGPAGGGILTRGVPGLAGLTGLSPGLGVEGLRAIGLTPGEVPLGAGDLMAAGDLIATGDFIAGGLMALAAILTAGLGDALGEKVLPGATLTDCLSLSFSPSSQSGCLRLPSGSELQTRQLQLPVEASLM